MEWKKTPPELAAKFDRAAPKDPRVVRKPMFGYPALYLGGNMFAGTFQDKVVARLSEQERAKVAKAGAKPFEPMPGRPMKEYVVIPPADVTSFGLRDRAVASVLCRRERIRGALALRGV